MAHILLDWTNLALFEAAVVTSQRLDRKLPAGEWAELESAVITAGRGDGVYTCQDATVPAKAELEAIVQYRIASVTADGSYVFGNVISVTIPALADLGVTNLTGEYVE